MDARDFGRAQIPGGASLQSMQFMAQHPFFSALQAYPHAPTKASDPMPIQCLHRGKPIGTEARIGDENGTGMRGKQGLELSQQRTLYFAVAQFFRGTTNSRMVKHRPFTGTAARSRHH